MLTPFEAQKRADALNEIAKDAHTNAVNHGFYDMIKKQLDAAGGDLELREAIHRDFILAQIAEIGSECGEAVAAIQHDDGVAAFSEELADIVIRVMSLADYLYMDIGNAIIGKMARNESRPRLHGKTC